jgi:hypothetical protein
MYLINAPAQKFSFDPPQLHTMPDLPIEEWYNYDWIGMIDSVSDKNKPSTIGSTYNYLSWKKPELLQTLKSKLAEILPANPSPKNAEETLFWQETQTLGLTPPKLRENMELIGLIGRGSHWQKDNVSNTEIYGPNGIKLLEGIQNHSDYQKAFDETISYDEREAIRIALDRLMRKKLNDDWKTLALRIESETGAKDQLRNLLKAVS